MDEEGWRDAQIKLGTLRVAATLFRYHFGSDSEETATTSPHALFAALADPKRLLLLQLLREHPGYVEALAETLELSPSTVSFHLKKLREAGLVRCDREQYYRVYRLERNCLRRSLDSVIGRQFFPRELLEARAAAYRQKVIGDFIKPCQLQKLPRQHKKRRIILEELARRFEPNRRYTEREVNRILAEVHEDVCTLRRELIAEQLLAHNQSLYRRVT